MESGGSHRSGNSSTFGSGVVCSYGGVFAPGEGRSMSIHIEVPVAYAGLNGRCVSVETIRPGADCLVVIPTYNERENIAAMIGALRSLSEPVDILVVDDNSPDGTAEVVKALIASEDGIYLLQRPGKQGLGNAYKAGFAFALQHGWSYIVQMDADFSHDPTDVSRLLSSCRLGSDITIGSRYVKGGRIAGWPLKRWLLSRCANLTAQIMLRSNIKDVTAGFKCFRREALEKIDLSKVASEGYVFQVEVNHRAKLEKLSIKQIPICFSDRRQGVSKMGKDEAVGGFKQLIVLLGLK